MAGSLVSDYGIGDDNIENMQLTLDKAYKGFYSLTITELDSDVVPQIAAGSWIDDNGALYKFDSNESPSTTDPVTSSTVADGEIYICLIPAGSSITAAFTATAPTWSDSKQGWYGTSGQANYRYLNYIMTKASTVYSYKIPSTFKDIFQKSIVEVSVGTGWTVANTGTTVSDPIRFNTKIIDVNSEFNTTSYYFQPKRSGIYHFSLNLTVGGHDAGSGNFTVLLSKNATSTPSGDVTPSIGTIYGSRHATTAAIRTYSVNAIATLDKNDIIYPLAFGGVVDSLSVYGDDGGSTKSTSRLSIMRLS